MSDSLSTKYYFEIHHSILKWMSVIFVPLSFLTAAIFLYFGLYFPAAAAIANGINYSLAGLFLYKGKIRVGKIIVAAGNPLTLFLGGLGCPDLLSIQVYYLMDQMFPFFLFSVKDNKKLIIKLCVLILFFQSLSLYYSISDFRFSFSTTNNEWLSYIDYFLAMSAGVSWVVFNYMFNTLNSNAVLKIQDQRNQIQNMLIEISDHVKFERDMLDNLSEGIFCVGENQEIYERYSIELERIIEETNLAKTNFFDKIFSNSNVSEETLSQIRTVMSMVGESVLNFYANRHLLPIDFEKKIKNRKKILRIKWNVIEMNGCMHLLLFSLTDVTSEKIRLMETEKQRKTIQIFRAIVQRGLDECISFAHQTKTLANSCIENCAMGGDFRVVSIETHTIKGNSRTFGLRSISEIAHDIENIFDQNRLDLSRHFDSIKRKYEEIVSIVDELEQIGRRFDKGASSKLKSTYSIKDIVSPIAKTLPALCKSKNLPQAKIHIEEESEGFNRNTSELLRNSLNHLIMNSISHGLETKAERISKGKPPEGNIYIKSYQYKSIYKIEYSDDGRGLNLYLLSEKLSLSKQANDEFVASQIFLPGVSTKSVVDETSGRGIGMDAVKSYIETQNGTIDILFTSPKNKDGYRLFKFEITLPSPVY